MFAQSSSPCFYDFLQGKLRDSDIANVEPLCRLRRDANSPFVGEVCAVYQKSFSFIPAMLCVFKEICSSPHKRKS